MNKFAEYADALVEEGLAEAADTFFGKRKRLEDDMELFHNKCRELQRIGEDVVAWAHGLGFVLRQGAGLADFYRAIGVLWNPESVLNGSACHKELACAFGIFGSTRYWKTVYAAYEELYTALDVYRHGRHYNDPERPGGKRRSICLETLTAWGQRINDTIDKVNRENDAANVLQFAKQFRGDEVEKEIITGGGVEYSLNEELAFAPIDLASCGLLVVPELPKPHTVKKRITSFALGLYNAHKAEILTLLKEVGG